MRRTSTLSLCVIMGVVLAGYAAPGLLPDDGANGEAPTDRSPTPAPTDSAGGQPPNYSTVVFDHARTGGPVIEGGIEYDPERTATRRFAAIVATDADRGRFNESLLAQSAPDAAAFIDRTDLSNATLLVYQEAPAASSPDYRVESVRRENGTLRVELNDSAAGGTADVTVETVLVRVRGDVPRVVFRTEDGTVTTATRASEASAS